jgi:phospholipase/lecithinase/hemolysin
MNLNKVSASTAKVALIALSAILSVDQAVNAKPINPISIDNVYVFGDSLVDVGNVYIASNQKLPLSPPYFQGRFSNGPVWIENLLARFSQPISPSLAGGKNFAFGGGPSGFFLKQPIQPGGPPPQTPGLLYQINTFIAPAPTVTANTLYFITAGGNDFLINLETNPNVPINNLKTAVSELYAYGARNIVLTNLPDLGKIPLINTNPTNAKLLSLLTNIFNFKLKTAMFELRITRPDLNIVIVDINTLLKRVTANPARYGLTNVTDACVGGTFDQPTIPCANPDQYFYWDIEHPTKVVGQLIADFAYGAIVDGQDSSEESADR